MSGSQFLSTREMLVIECLAEAWNAFVCLPQVHSDDVDEFRHAIHLCQRLVMSRPVQNEFNKVTKNE
jgi:hypothetical protein